MSVESREIIGSIIHNIESCFLINLGTDGFWQMLRAIREEEIRTGLLLRMIDKLAPDNREIFWLNVMQHMLQLLPGDKTPRKLLAMCKHDISVSITKTCEISGMLIGSSCQSSSRTVSRGFGISW
nr:hypothetical protein [Candidatus Sigynarchaeota archaeon]